MSSERKRNRKDWQIKKFKHKITTIRGKKKVNVIPAVVSALGALTTDFEKYITGSGIDIKVEHAPKTAFVGITKIFKLVLGCWRKYDMYHCRRHWLKVLMSRKIKLNCQLQPEFPMQRVDSELEYSKKCR